MRLIAILGLIAVLTACARQDHWTHPNATSAQQAAWALQCRERTTVMMAGTPTRPAPTPYLGTNNAGLATFSTGLSNTQMMIAAMPRRMHDKKAFRLCMEAGGYRLADSVPTRGGDLATMRQMGAGRAAE